MESIEVISSSHRTVKTIDAEGYTVVQKVPVWNPTIANLTLMALGSSAPEILIAVIETVSTLGSTPGELGPSTIVGSAAFNLLVISGISILSVTPKNDSRTDKEIEEDGTPKGIKKINDLGVFACTTFFSLFAYVWMFLSLQDGIIEVYEAVVTLGCMILLVGFAYMLDKWN